MKCRWLGHTPTRCPGGDKCDEKGTDMTEQKIAPVLSEDERAAIASQHRGRTPFDDTYETIDRTEQAVLARVGAVRDQALQDAVTELEKRRRLLHVQLEALNISDADAVYGISIDAIRALKGTPAAAVGEPERVVMGLGKVAVGTCVRDTDGVPGIIYLRIPGDAREHGVSTSDIYPVGNAAPAGSVLACVYFLTAQTVQQSIDTLHELLARHFPDAPQPSTNPGPLAAVERMAVILKALQSAQNNLASHRPHGSSDPESDDYDHDAFMWDYYQRAIDAAIAASKEGAKP